MDLVRDTITGIVKRVPAVLPHLKGDALVIALAGESPRPYDETKTVQTYYNALRSAVSAVYNNTMGYEFTNILFTVMVNELVQAKQAAYDESDISILPEAEQYVSGVIQNEASYIEGYYLDIRAARLKGLPLEPLLQRARTWANRWNDVYNAVKRLISAAYGEKMIWVYGDADHCSTCEQLNGIVAYAKEWQDLGVQPQSPPNGKLRCGGWRCQCQLAPTDQRKTRGAVAKISAIVGG